jgi:hypothetical protein
VAERQWQRVTVAAADRQTAETENSKQKDSRRQQAGEQAGERQANRQAGNQAGRRAADKQTAGGQADSRQAAVGSRLQAVRLHVCGQQSGKQKAGGRRVK